MSLYVFFPTSFACVCPCLAERTCVHSSPVSFVRGSWLAAWLLGNAFALASAAGAASGGTGTQAVAIQAEDAVALRSKFEEWFSGWEHAQKDNKGESSDTRRCSQSTSPP